MAPTWPQMASRCAKMASKVSKCLLWNIQNRALAEAPCKFYRICPDLPRPLVSSLFCPLEASRRCKMAPKWHQEGSKMAPRWPSQRLFNAARSPPRDCGSVQDLPGLLSCCQDGLRWLQNGPRWLQDGARWLQDGPRWSQGRQHDTLDSSKILPRPLFAACHKKMKNEPFFKQIGPAIH